MGSDESANSEHRERLRERFVHGDPSSRTDEALLELLLTYGIPRRDVQPLAKSLLARFGTLDQALAADPSALQLVDGVGPHVSTLLNLADQICLARVKSTPASEAQQMADDAQDVTPQPGARSTPSLPLAQSEIPLDIPGQSELPLGKEPPTDKASKTIQDALIAEGLLALKIAHEAKSPQELQELLVKRLGQNSMVTRRRYSHSLLKWFFPDGLSGLLPLVWRAYEDEAISIDLLRWSYLNQEPILGRCVADALFPCENGLVVPPTYFDKYLQDHLGEPPAENTRKRLKTNLKKLGFLDRAKGKADRLLPVPVQKTSFLIVFHHLFAPRAVRTVELRNLLANPFWKYLGYKSEDAVRSLLREADAAGLVGKYVVADQLEQVTTCFTLDEILERRARL